MKKLMSLVITGIMLISGTTMAFAESNSYNEYVNDAIYVENGVPRRVTEIELDKLINESIRVDTSSLESHFTGVSSINTRGEDYYKYINYMIDDYIDTAKGKRVTPYTQGPASISYGNSETFASSFSISLSAPIKSAMGSIGTTKSYSSSSQFGTAFTIKSGERKAVFFYPRVNEYKGKLSKISWLTAAELSSETIYSKHPVKLGSFADGLYRLE